MTDICHPFPKTRWTVLSVLASSDEGERRRVVEGFLATYLPPLTAFVRWRFQIQESDVEDFVNGFIADKVVGKNLLAQVDRGRGKLRSFLQKSIEHYCIDQMRKRRDVPAEQMVRASLQEGAIETACVFDEAWARHVLATAADRIREEFEGKNRPEVWQVLRGRTLHQIFDQPEPTPYAVLSEQMGYGESELQALLVTGKRGYARQLKAVVGEYTSPQALEQELADLMGIVAERRH